MGYIIGAVKSIRTQRFKPCKILYNSILLTCQCKPTLFINDNVVSAIISALRRDIAAGFKTTSKGNVYNQILFVNMLLHGFGDTVHWPEIFVKVLAT